MSQAELSGGSNGRATPAALPQDLVKVPKKGLKFRRGCRPGPRFFLLIFIINNDLEPNNVPKEASFGGFFHFSKFLGRMD